MNLWARMHTRDRHGMDTRDTGEMIETLSYPGPVYALVAPTASRSPRAARI